ncbi:MAG TPA: hypothetical protein VHB73_07670, partial [Alphaproteobacteria bacterium]|nr:hypothetical protein [Alphaproteobacteria bacterium]
ANLNNIDVNALVRALTLEGTALAAGLDQLMVKTAQGEILLKIQQMQDQALMSLLPSRVTLQLRPGPDGPQAILVVGNKPVIPDKPPESLSAGTALSGNQTLAPEIPRTNQIYQTLVLPSSLFSPQLAEAQLLAPLIAEELLPPPTTKDEKQNQPGNAIPNGNKAAVNSPSSAVSASVSRSSVPIFARSIPPSPAPSVQSNPFTALLQKLGFLPEVSAALTPPTSVSVPPAPAPSLFTPAATAQASSAPELPQPMAIKILALVTDDDTQIAQVKAPPDTTSQAKAQADAATSQTQKTALNTAVIAEDAPEGNVQVATVRGNTPSGQPVLSLGDRTIVVQGARNWPVGMQVKVLVGPEAALALPKLEGKEDAKMFPALRQALEILAASAPEIYADMARLRLPQAQSSQMPGALLFLFTALGKDASQWLGDDLPRILKDLGKEQLLHEIQEQWRAQMNQDVDGPGGEWRGTSIPVFDHEKMQLLRFYIYDPPGERGKKGGKRNADLARRFLIDIDLSRLGPLQLDGLVHRKRLDL